MQLLKADFFKLSKSISPWVLFILAMVSAIIFAACSHYVATGRLGFETASGSLSLFSETQMMALLGSIAAGICLTTDFENKVIENAVSGGYSRNAIIINKMVSFFILIALLYLPYVIITMIFSSTDTVFSNFIPTSTLNILSEAATQEFTAGLFGNILITSSVSLLIFISQLMVGIFYMFLFKKAVLVIAATYMTSLILGPISSLNETVHSVMAYTPYGIDLSRLTLVMSGEFIIKSVIISFLFIFIFYLASFFLFRKAEVK
ncbi:ABC transporter permease [Oceanobacillus jeddahense]|uniref:ABC transporter permease n=1 Tax=Oceanobacillus jeddahense TaxID=1462527 RepID=UPI000595DB65|nr:ABC transporter permease [Oceanobacillus jeddahense]